MVNLSALANFHHPLGFFMDLIAILLLAYVGHCIQQECNDWNMLGLPQFRDRLGLESCGALLAHGTTRLVWKLATAGRDN